MNKKIIPFLIFGLIVFVFALLVARPINFATADLGRHLKNGEIFWTTLKIPQGNFYSFTFPNFPFVNHHWGTGALFYFIKAIFGFKGLSIFYILTSVATLFVFLAAVWRRVNWFVLSLFSILALPVVSSRVEIRPEVFSYFLMAVFFFILLKYQQNGNRKILWWFPPLMFVWANLHIYFVFGLFLIGVFWLEELINFKKEESKKKLKELTIFGFVSVAVAFLNPAGLKGVLYPFQIFNNYGYRLFENQSVTFLSKLISYPPSTYFKILLGVFVLSWLWKIFWIIKNKEKFPLAFFILSVFFSVFAWSAIRNFPLFGYFALAIGALNVGLSFRRPDEYRTEESRDSLPCRQAGIAPSGLGMTFNSNLLPLVSLIILFTVFFFAPFYRGSEKLGIGLMPGAEAAGKFFLVQKIKGPIFNNYDIGGYLIYYLYPNQKVFVDNRPEAYPAEFFDKTYIAAQENDARWQELDAEYDFNAIFFYRLDLTPWGQKFLIARAKDLNWRVIFVDAENIIFVKDNDQNKELIKKFGLPREMFGETK